MHLIHSTCVVIKRSGSTVDPLDFGCFSLSFSTYVARWHELILSTMSTCGAGSVSGIYLGWSRVSYAAFYLTMTIGRRANVFFLLFFFY